MDKFRSDCVEQFDSVITTDKILKEIELYNELDIKD